MHPPHSNLISRWKIARVEECKQLENYDNAHDLNFQ